MEENNKTAQSTNKRITTVILEAEEIKEIEIQEKRS